MQCAYIYMRPCVATAPIPEVSSPVLSIIVACLLSFTKHFQSVFKHFVPTNRHTRYLYYRVREHRKRAKMVSRLLACAPGCRRVKIPPAPLVKGGRSSLCVYGSRAMILLSMLLKNVIILIGKQIGDLSVQFQTGGFGNFK